MKKMMALLCLLLLLCSCAGSRGFEPKTVCEHYAAVGAVSGKADITTNTGVMLKYSISIATEELGTRITIEQPESLYGISAIVRRDLATVSYDGAVLEMLLPPYFGFVPISAFDGVMADLQSGVPTHYSFEDYAEVSAIALSYRAELNDFVGEKRVFIAEEGYGLLGAEFYLDGNLVMEMTLTEFEAG